MSSIPDMQGDVANSNPDSTIHRAHRHRKSRRTVEGPSPLAPGFAMTIMTTRIRDDRPPCVVTARNPALLQADVRIRRWRRLGSIHGLARTAGRNGCRAARFVFIVLMHTALAPTGVMNFRSRRGIL